MSVSPVVLDDLAGGYTLVSRLLLAPPDGALLAHLGAPGGMDDWPFPDERQGARLIARGAAASVRELTLDHQRLFIGPGQLLATPYESVYRSEEHLVFEMATFEVRSCYRAFGLQAPALNREPDDHLGLELSFLAHLSALAPESPEALEAQRSFLHEHTLTFGPSCLDQVIEHAETDFYRGVGLLGQDLLTAAAAVFS